MNERAPTSARSTALAKFVRDGDYDRFLTVLFAPPDRRDALFAVIGFNLETARVHDAVREPMLGQIRLQWWRDALNEASAGKPRRHDVLEGLTGAGSAAALLDEMLEAREIEYAPEPPQTLAEFKAYASGTSGALSEAIAAMLGADEGARAVARAAGTAFGMVGILRATRFLASRGRVLLPSHVLDASGTSAAAVKELRADAGLARAAERIARSAEEELKHARARLGSIPKSARAALLLAPLTRAYLARLRAANFDVLNGDLSLSPLRKQVVVGWSAVRGKF